jgi:hypothetical protein
VAPYTQFVGRALRALPDGTDTDNLAHVVAHAGLNQEAHWQYFKNETEEAQVQADLAAPEMDGTEDASDGSDAEKKRQADDTDPAEVTKETIEGFDVDAYLPVAADADEAEQHLDDMEQALDALREKGLDVPDADDIKDEIATLNQPLGDEDLPPPANRPARERRAYRKILNNTVRRAAGTILRRLDVPDAADLADAVGQGDEESNVEVVIRLLHRRTNAAVGRDDNSDGRNDWPLADLKAAKSHVAAVRDAVRSDIEAALDADLSSDDSLPTDAPAPDDEDAGWDDVDEFDWGNPFDDSG